MIHVMGYHEYHGGGGGGLFRTVERYNLLLFEYLHGTEHHLRYS